MKREHAIGKYAPAIGATYDGVAWVLAQSSLLTSWLVHEVKSRELFPKCSSTYYSYLQTTTFTPVDYCALLLLHSVQPGCCDFDSPTKQPWAIFNPGVQKPAMQ